jgi:hypothetical protein
VLIPVPAEVFKKTPPRKKTTEAKEKTYGEKEEGAVSKPKKVKAEKEKDNSETAVKAKSIKKKGLLPVWAVQ